MVFLYHPWIPRGDDKMGHYVHYIGGGIVDSKYMRQEMQQKVLNRR